MCLNKACSKPTRRVVCGLLPVVGWTSVNGERLNVIPPYLTISPSTPPTVPYYSVWGRGRGGVGGDDNKPITKAVCCWRDPIIARYSSAKWKCHSKPASRRKLTNTKACWSWTISTGEFATWLLLCCLDEEDATVVFWITTLPCISPWNPILVKLIWHETRSPAGTGNSQETQSFALEWYRAISR